MASHHNCRLFKKVLGSFMKVRHIRLKTPTCRHLSSTTCCQKNILYGAVCLQRLSVITAPKNNLETRFSEMLAQIELENSYLSDFEVQLKKEALISKKAVETEDDEETTEGETVTALDMQDIWEAEVKQFVPASRETEADKTNDQHSLERKLDSSLYLLVKQNIEGKDHWVLPQALWEQGETLRETAERALSSLCGEVRASFLGNAPCAVAKFDPKVKDGDKKVKLFFFQAWYKAGEVTPNKGEAKDYLWVTREELANYCHGSYQKHLKKFILDL